MARSTSPSSTSPNATPTRTSRTTRRSSRRSGPGASRRPRVSEHPLTTPLTGPPGNSVDGGLSTVEVRWILPGPLDAAIAGWYRRFPAGRNREDAYLIHPVLRGLSVKLRAGRELEVKSCHGYPGILEPSAWSVGAQETACQPIPARQRTDHGGHPGSG